MDVPGRIETLDQLARLYRAPSARAAGKVVTSIDDASARFIDRCTFVVVSTSGGHGSSEASLRGGPPGFVQRLDDRRVAIPDLAEIYACQFDGTDERAMRATVEAIYAEDLARD